MKLLSALLAEAIGVFGLCFIGVLAIHAAAGQEPTAGLVGVAIAHGLILGIGITAFMAVSGGHLNPAVTIGLFVGGKIKAGPAFAYIVAQCVGGIFAGVVVMSIFGKIDGARICAEGSPVIPMDMTHHLTITYLGAAIAEAVATFFLVTAVWGTAGVDPRAPKIGGLGVGLVVVADILAIGPLTGAAMNPARAFGPAAAAWLGGGTYDWSMQWIYWVGPILGGMLASLIYKGFMMPKSES